MTLDEHGSLVHRATGTALTVAGLKLLAAGAVSDVGTAATGLAVGRVCEGAAINIVFEAGVGGDPPVVHGDCTCDAVKPCAHVVAVVLARGAAGVPGRARSGALAPHEPSRDRPAGPERAIAGWERALNRVVVPGAAPPAGQDRSKRPPSVGLRLELAPADGSRPARLLARPVLRTPTGGWSTTGAVWSAYGYSWSGGRDARRMRLIGELAAMSEDDGIRYSHRANVLDLSTVTNRRLWDVLCELRDAGLPFVQPGRSGGDVVVHDPLGATVFVHGEPDGLRVTAGLVTGDGCALPGDGTHDLGTPPRALAWQVASAGQDGAGRLGNVLHLAPVPAVLADRLDGMRRLSGTWVPQVDAERFVRTYLPRLGAGIEVRTSGDVPAAPTVPRVRLQVSSAPDATVDLRWDWSGSGLHDHPVERAHALGRVLPTLATLPELDPGGRAAVERTLPGDVTLRGHSAVRFVDEVLPALRDVDGVALELGGELPRFRPARSAPSLTFEPAEDGDRDWFDLAVTVEVDGEPVPFPLLFTALVREDSHLVLPSGTYFPLDDERFADLRRLIEESRALNDGPERGIRLSRYQADAWAELERLGVVAGQARDWLAAVRAVALAPTVVEHPPPVGLEATLRPYQRAGFGWLAALYDNGLGGVLADDMGLGKTVQTLALICHVRERGASDRPFLVVAPTSVVGAWAAEAARFAPGLRVATVTQTAARRGGTKIGDLAAGADLVVTSYTLFRIEHDQYSCLEWAGLVLDEAQNVKNHTSRGYQCARTLDAPFKLAITGTPMENNLLELWAVVSVVAPGLLSNPARFTEYYRAPVERDHDADRLALLRRRIAPLVLRRAKDSVAAELPPKQEQILEIELAPKHRAAYQAYLQRERRKVLGLVDDLARNRFEILRSLTLLRQAALDIGLVDGDPGRVPATKLDVLDDLAAGVVAEGHRVLVFSQFTRFLGAARDRLQARGIPTWYLDGKTRRRPEVIERFRQGDAGVFLISLKAGGTGLTLTEADYCILLDPWWNPATENQAVDRTHRIGQTRSVMVYRLVAKDTIEEKVMALKAAKAELFTSVLDGGELASSALTAEDIRRLVA